MPHTNRNRLDPEVAAIVSHEDWQTMLEIVGPSRIMAPSLTIAPAGENEPYIYRWYVAKPSRPIGCVMMHLQVASDPERPLHDHPWDNQSVILAGRYTEFLQSQPPYGVVEEVERHKGDVITRAATEAHRLILPPDVHYTLTLFSTGPSIRTWGFWYGDEWHSWSRHVETRNGVSVHVNRDDRQLALEQPATTGYISEDDGDAPPVAGHN